MGLDGVELVMEVEDVFGIRLTDDQAVSAETFGQLCQVVLAKVKERLAKGCLCNKIFYRLRRTLMGSFGAKREAVKLPCRLGQFLPAADRRAEWQRLREALGLELPRLRKPLWLNRGLLAISVLAAIGAAALTGIWPFRTCGLAGMDLLVVGLTFVSTLALGHLLTAPCANHLPAGCSTIRGFVDRLLYLNHGKPREGLDLANEAEVRSVLRSIVVEKLSVRPEQVMENARFVQDLGV